MAGLMTWNKIDFLVLSDPTVSVCVSPFSGTIVPVDVIDCKGGHS